MNDQGINRWLLDTYGSTIDGYALFKIEWTTDYTEVRKGTFIDYYGEIIIREVTEVRRCLKYPFAQNRWVLEVIKDTPEGNELVSKYSYEEVYIFQDRNQRALEMNRQKVMEAIYFYFKAKEFTWKQRTDIRMQMLAERHKKLRERNRELMGDRMRSPLFLVIGGMR